MFKKPAISLIAALGPDGVIGRKGKLLYHLSSDMRYFKMATMGKPVVMGRKTYESIPEKFRPLEGRVNIVLTRDITWSAPGVHVIHKIEDMFKFCGDAPEIMIAGGAEIYDITLKMANKLYITDISNKKDDSSIRFAEIEQTPYKVDYVNIFSPVKQKEDVYFPILPWEDSEWRQVNAVKAPESDFEVVWRIYERA